MLQYKSFFASLLVLLFTMQPLSLHSRSTFSQLFLWCRLDLWYHLFLPHLKREICIAAKIRNLKSCTFKASHWLLDSHCRCENVLSQLLNSWNVLHDETNCSVLRGKFDLRTTRICQKLLVLTKRLQNNFNSTSALGLCHFTMEMLSAGRLTAWSMT